MLGVKGASFSSVFLGLAFGVGVSCQARLTLSLVNDAGLCCILGQDQSTRWYCQTCKAVNGGGSPTCLYSTIRCRNEVSRFTTTTRLAATIIIIILFYIKFELLLIILLIEENIIFIIIV